MRKSIQLLVLVLSFTTIISAYSQDSLKRKVFISFHTGIYAPSDEHFSKIYGDIIFTNGLSVGIPVSTSFFIYGKGMFFRKEGKPFITKVDLQGTHVVQEGSIVINHLYFDIGIQKNFHLKNGFVIPANLGITLIKSYTDATTPVENHIKSGGMTGYFIGTGLEKLNIYKSFSLFTELQYNHTFESLEIVGGNYSAGVLNVGIRYYIP